MSEPRDDGPRFIVAEDLGALERFRAGLDRPPAERLLRLGLVAENASGWSLTMRGEGVAELALDKRTAAQL